GGGGGGGAGGRRERGARGGGAGAPRPGSATTSPPPTSRPPRRPPRTATRRRSRSPAPPARGAAVHHRPRGRPRLDHLGCSHRPDPPDALLGRRADRLRLLRERAAVGGRGCADAAPAGVRAELRAPVPERMVLERRVLPGARRAEAAMTTSDRDLGYRPATELAGLVRARKISPVELTDALLRRIEQVNPAL